MEKIQWKFFSGKIQSFQHMEEQQDIYLTKKSELKLTFCVIRKINSKGIIEQNMKPKTIQHTEENLCGLEIGKDF